MNVQLNRWRILIASTIINICVGAIYAFSIFALPLTKVFSVSMPDIMIAFTINAAISPIPMILGGKLVDKGERGRRSSSAVRCSGLASFSRAWLLHLDAVYHLWCHYRDWPGNCVFLDHWQQREALSG